MRQLGRQAGSALTQTRTVPAPDDLRLELIGVPAGADVPLEVRFEAVSEGVLVTGTAIAPLAGECARCLAPLTSSVIGSLVATSGDLATALPIFDESGQLTGMVLS